MKKFIDNYKIYFMTLVISIILIIPSLIFGNQPFLSALAGIGCSGIAAAIMAVFLERYNNQNEQKKIQKAKSLYFKQLYDQLIMTLERILWFDERLSDDAFDWNLPDEVYLTMKYMLAMSSQYPSKQLSYEEAIVILKKIGEKYNLDNIKLLEEKDRNKVIRLFQIVAASSLYLLKEANTINENKLLLEIEDYLSIDDCKKIMFDISLGIGIMQKKDMNYKAAIDCLISTTEMLRKIGLYKNDIEVRLHGSVSISEL